MRKTDKSNATVLSLWSVGKKWNSGGVYGVEMSIEAQLERSCESVVDTHASFSHFQILAPLEISKTALFML